MFEGPEEGGTICSGQEDHAAGNGEEGPAGSLQGSLLHSGHHIKHFHGRVLSYSTVLSINQVLALSLLLEQDCQYPETVNILKSCTVQASTQANVL